MNRIIPFTTVSILSIYSALATGSGTSVYKNSFNYTSALESPITTLTTQTLDKGGWGFSQRTEYYRSSSLPDSLLLQSPDYESQTGYLVNYLFASYGVTDAFVFGVAEPYLNGSNIRASLPTATLPSPSAQNLGDVAGLADTSIYGLWRIFDETEKRFAWSIALTSGSSFPTGKTNVKTHTGTVFATSDQPGTGAFAPFAGIVLSKQYDRLLLSSNVIYTKYTRGSQATTLGWEIDYNTAAVYILSQKTQAKPFSYSVNGILELNGEYTAPDTINGSKDPNSAANIINLAPGLHINWGENISTYLSVSFPISQQISGIQSRSQYNVYSCIDFTF